MYKCNNCGNEKYFEETNVIKTLYYKMKMVI